MQQQNRLRIHFGWSIGLFVALVICALPTRAAEPQPVPVEVLRGQLTEAMENGDLDQSAELAEQIAFAELVEYLDASYTLLRIHCQRGDVDQAMATVDSMLDAGYWDFRKLLSDEELQLINGTEALRTKVRGAWTQQYMAMLDRPSRDVMQMPEQVVQHLAIQPGDVVADIGAGSGYFTVRLARATGRYGTVIATDTRQEMLDHIAGRLADEHLDNVELIKVEPTETGLPERTVDLTLMVDVIHYVRDRAAYARQLSEAVAPGGRVAIIDFRYDPEAEREFAPPPEQQVPRTVLDEEMASAGFHVVAEHDFLPEQYFVIYQLEESPGA